MQPTRIALIYNEDGHFHPSRLPALVVEYPKDGKLALWTLQFNPAKASSNWGIAANMQRKFPQYLGNVSIYVLWKLVNSASKRTVSS